MTDFYDINIYNMLTQQLEKSLQGSLDRRRSCAAFPGCSWRSRGIRPPP